LELYSGKGLVERMGEGLEMILTGWRREEEGRRQRREEAR